VQTDTGQKMNSTVDLGCETKLNNQGAKTQRFLRTLFLCYFVVVSVGTATQPKMRPKFIQNISRNEYVKNFTNFSCRVVAILLASGSRFKRMAFSVWFWQVLIEEVVALRRSKNYIDVSDFSEVDKLVTVDFRRRRGADRRRRNHGCLVLFYSQIYPRRLRAGAAGAFFPQNPCGRAGD